jgi:hypothetical protein
MHSLHRGLGVAMTAFTQSISVYKYGDGPNDDQTLIGCLDLLQDERKRERVQVNNFGIIESSTMIQQGTVEGHYEMFLAK